MPVPPLVLGGALACCAALVLIVWAAFGSRNHGATVLENLRSGLPAADLRELVLAQGAGERAVRPAVNALTARLRSVAPAGYVERLQRYVVLAGRDATWPVERLLAAKFILAGALGLIGVPLLLGGGAGRVFGLLLTVVPFFAPDVFMSGRGQERQLQIRREMPDTIDQITITVEAGLGLEAAIARVAKSGTGPLADELVRMLQDVQVGVPRAQALKRMLARTDVAELRQFVNAVVQAEGYGVPIGQVLRVQSLELRDKRRQRAEEQAMKLPVKVLFPLIACIFPTMFIVLVGPAVMDIAKMFQAM